jgi:hypothetical protein
MTLVNLVSPPLYGILNQVHPYVHLSNSHLLEQPSYIAGVINPMLMDKKFYGNFDLLIRVGNPNPLLRKGKGKNGNDSNVPSCIVPQNDDGKHPNYYDYKTMKYKSFDQ